VNTNTGGNDLAAEKGAMANQLDDTDITTGDDRVRGSGLTSDKLLGLAKTIFNKPITADPAYQKLQQNKVALAKDEPYEMQIAKKQALDANTRSAISQNQTTDATLNAITGLQTQANKTNTQMQDLANRSGMLQQRRDQQLAGENDNTRMETEFNNGLNVANQQSDLQKAVANRQHQLQIADEIQNTMLQNRMEKDQKTMLNNQMDENIAQNEYGEQTADMKGQIANVTAKRDAVEKELNVDNAYIKHYETKGVDKLTAEEKADYDKRKIELQTKTDALKKHNEELSGTDGTGGLNLEMKALPKKYNESVVTRRNKAINSGGDKTSKFLQSVFKSGGKTVSLQDKKELIKYKEEIKDLKGGIKDLQKINLEYSKLFAKIKGDKNSMYVKMLNSLKSK
jgi:hypothetical protein